MSLFHRTITVSPGTQLVEYVRGAFTRVLEPGRHRRPWHTAEYVRVQTRAQLATLAPQEVPTADGLTVRATAAVRWSVTDARQYLDVAVAPFDHVYLAVQVALRDAVVTAGAAEAAAVLRATSLLEAAEAAGREVGITVHDVVVKDVLLPTELRSAQAELVTARTRGQAELEKARAETAALRSLANAAKLLDEHPALAQLRLVQALPYGAKVELLAPSRD